MSEAFESIVRSLEEARRHLNGEDVGAIEHHFERNPQTGKMERVETVYPASFKKAPETQPPTNPLTTYSLSWAVLAP